MTWDVPVERYTTPNPVTATEDMSTDELTALMQANDVRHLPVVRDGTVVGLVSDRDVRVAQGLSDAHKIQVRAADIMAADPVMMSASRHLDDVAYVMADKKIGSVIVNDEGGRFLGIFTITDALIALIEMSRTARADR